MIDAGTDFHHDGIAVIDTGATTSCIYVSKHEYDKISREYSLIFVPVGLPCNKILQTARISGIHLFRINIINGNERVSLPIDRLLIASSTNENPLSIIGMDVLSKLIVTMNVDNTRKVTIKHSEKSMDNTTLNNSICADISNRFLVSGD